MKRNQTHKNNFDLNKIECSIFKLSGVKENLQLNDHL